MKSCFYRPAAVNLSEFQNILTEIQKEQQKISEKTLSLGDAAEYVTDLIEKAKIFPHNPKMAFWCFDDPQNMPADFRVDFVYTPTYYLTANLLTLAVQHPTLLEQIEAFPIALERAMEASAGREFKGAGYDEFRGELDAMKIFARAPVSVFLRKYSDFCPAFADLWQTCFNELSDSLKTGSAARIPDEWSGMPTDYSGEIQEMIECTVNTAEKFE